MAGEWSLDNIQKKIIYDKIVKPCFEDQNFKKLSDNDKFKYINYVLKRTKVKANYNYNNQDNLSQNRYWDTIHIKPTELLNSKNRLKELGLWEKKINENGNDKLVFHAFGLVAFVLTSDFPHREPNNGGILSLNSNSTYKAKKIHLIDEIHKQFIKESLKLNINGKLDGIQTSQIAITVIEQCIKEDSFIELEYKDKIKYVDAVIKATSIKANYNISKQDHIKGNSLDDTDKEIKKAIKHLTYYKDELIAASLWEDKYKVNGKEISEQFAFGFIHKVLAHPCPQRQMNDGPNSGLLDLNRKSVYKASKQHVVDEINKQFKVFKNKLVKEEKDRLDSLNNLIQSNGDTVNFAKVAKSIYSKLPEYDATTPNLEKLDKHYAKYGDISNNIVRAICQNYIKNKKEEFESIIQKAKDIFDSKFRNLPVSTESLKKIFTEKNKLVDTRISNYIEKEVKPEYLRILNDFEVKFKDKVDKSVINRYKQFAGNLNISAEYIDSLQDIKSIFLDSVIDESIHKIILPYINDRISWYNEAEEWVKELQDSTDSPQTKLQKVSNKLSSLDYNQPKDKPYIYHLNIYREELNKIISNIPQAKIEIQNKLLNLGVDNYAENLKTIYDDYSTIIKDQFFCCWLDEKLKNLKQEYIKSVKYAKTLRGNSISPQSKIQTINDKLSNLDSNSIKDRPLILLLKKYEKSLEKEIKEFKEIKINVNNMLDSLQVGSSYLDDLNKIKSISNNKLSEPFFLDEINKHCVSYYETYQRAKEFVSDLKERCNSYGSCKTLEVINNNISNVNGNSIEARLKKYHLENYKMAVEKLFFLAKNKIKSKCMWVDRFVLDSKYRFLLVAAKDRFVYHDSYVETQVLKYINKKIENYDKAAIIVDDFKSSYEYVRLNNKDKLKAIKDKLSVLDDKVPKNKPLIFLYGELKTLVENTIKEEDNKKPTPKKLCDLGFL